MNFKKLHDDSLKRDLHRTRKNKTGNLLGTQGVSSDVPEENLTDVFNEMDTKEGIDSSYKKDLKKQFGDSADNIDMNLKNIHDSRKSLIERYNDSAKSLKKLLLDYKNKLVDSKCISDAVKKHNEIVDSLKSIIKDTAGSFQEATSDEPVVDTNIESPESASPSLNPDAKGGVQQGTSLVDSKVTDSYESKLTEKAIQVFSNKFSIEAIKRKLDKELCPTFRLLMGNLIVSVNRTDPKHSDDSQELMVEINNEEVLEPSQFFSYEEDKQASEIQACALDYVKNNEWAIEMIADIYDLYDNIE